MPLSIRRDHLLPGRNFIGRWCHAEEGRRFDVTDPATNAVVASVPDSGAADARAALDAAHAAFRRLARRCLPGSARRSSSAGTTSSWRTRRNSAG